VVVLYLPPSPCSSSRSASACSAQSGPSPAGATALAAHAGGLVTAVERERELARYTDDSFDEANGEWWLSALKLAAARGLGVGGGSSLEMIAPGLLERCAAELFYAGGATVPWVRGRCERVPQSRMTGSLAALGARPSLLTDAEKHGKPTSNLPFIAMYRSLLTNCWRLQPSTYAAS
jgi:hypothetical protein